MAGKKKTIVGLTDGEKLKRKDHWFQNKGYLAGEVEGSDVDNLGDSKAELFIGTKGNIKIQLHGGSVVTLKNVPSGTYLRGIFVNKVFATGTTAKDIVAIY